MALVGQLKAQWTVFAGLEGRDVATHLATFSERLNDSRYKTMAAAVSQTLAQVSREIAREIIDRPTGSTSTPNVQVGP